ncbi:MAG: stage sporulation protein, partial [Actinomycetota bacterium]|nr:stage sporulation protein [Actinomycetota bacterium]
MFLLTRVVKVADVKIRYRLAAASVVLMVAASVGLAGPALADRVVTIDGGGFGHGIGMSQYGAYGRALEGRNSTQILEHYYTGAKVSEREMPESIRIGLYPGYGASTKSVSFSSKGMGDKPGTVALIVADAKERLTDGDAGTSWRIEAASSGGVNIFRNGHQFKKDGRTVFGDGAHPVIVKYAKFDSLLHINEKNNDFRYGEMDIGSFRCSSGRCLRVVLDIPMQKYIYGL